MQRLQQLKKAQHPHLQAAGVVVGADAAAGVGPRRQLALVHLTYQRAELQLRVVVVPAAVGAAAQAAALQLAMAKRA